MASVPGDNDSPVVHGFCELHLNSQLYTSVNESLLYFRAGMTERYAADG
jgi:hypothetical protein